MKTHVIQNFAYLVVIVALFAIIYFTSPFVSYQPQGTFLASTKQIYPISNETKILETIPSNARQIGVINMMLHSEAANQNDQKVKTVLYAALKKAALHGGTGLVIKQLYFLPKFQYGELLAGYHLRAIAVRQEGK